MTVIVKELLELHGNHGLAVQWCHDLLILAINYLSSPGYSFSPSFIHFASLTFHYSHHFADAVPIGLRHWFPQQFLSLPLPPFSDDLAISKKHLQGQVTFYFALLASHAGLSI